MPEYVMRRRRIQSPSRGPLAGDEIERSMQLQNRILIQSNSPTQVASFNTLANSTDISFIARTKNTLQQITQSSFPAEPV
jgi:hypothetical protein